MRWLHMKLLPRCHIYIPSSRLPPTGPTGSSDPAEPVGPQAARCEGHLSRCTCRTGVVPLHLKHEPAQLSAAVYIGTTEEEYQLMMKLLVSCLKSQISSLQLLVFNLFKLKSAFCQLNRQTEICRRLETTGNQFVSPIRCHSHTPN